MNPPPESFFETLKAEHEPWLGDVFVSPPVLDQLKQERSSILYGAAGSGKTALRLVLKGESPASAFVVYWQPEPILESPGTGTALAYQAMNQAMRACAESLVLEGGLPGRLREPSDFILSSLQWFLRKYLPFNNPVFFIQSRADHLGREAAEWFLRTMEKPLPALWEGETAFGDQINLLQSLLRAAGYEKLWLTADGLERWVPRALSEQVKSELGAVFSTLAFFDKPGVSFKFFLPLSFEDALHQTGAVERYRAFESRIKWDEAGLVKVLESRLKRAFDSEKASLAALCDDDLALEWLKEYGGDTPRGWLERAAPLAQARQKHGRRLSLAQTREALWSSPPPIRLNRERKEALIGCKPVSLASNEFRLMEYLFNHLREICPLEELYYYTYKEMETVPDKGDKQWEHPDNWRGIMDTLLWRLRQKIEPNPSEPIYLATRRGKGVELLHAEL